MSKENRQILTLCPKCSSIPLIHIVEADKPDLIKIKCKCSENEIYKDIIPVKDYLNKMEEINNQNKNKNKCEIEKENDEENEENEDIVPCQKEATDYCVQCKKWFCEQCLIEHNDFVENHIITKTKIMNPHIECEKHNTDANYFCRQCLSSFCNICRQNDKSHMNHEVVDIIEKYGDNCEERKCDIDKEDHYYCKSCDINRFFTYHKKREHLLQKADHIIIDLLEQPRNMIKILNDNLKRTKDKINKYNKQIKKDLIKQLEEEIKKINSAYKKNREINKNVVKLVNNIIGTYKIFAKQGKFNFQLFNNVIYNTRVNFPTVPEVENNKDTCLEKINNLIHFYNSKFIFGKREIKNENFYEVTSFGTEKKDVNSILLLKNGNLCIGLQDKIKVYDKQFKLLHEKEANGFLSFEEIDDNLIIYFTATDEKKKFNLWSIPKEKDGRRDEIRALQVDETADLVYGIFNYSDKNFASWDGEKMQYWSINKKENSQDIEIKMLDIKQKKLRAFIKTQKHPYFVFGMENHIKFFDDLESEEVATITRGCNGCGILEFAKKDLILFGYETKVVLVMDVFNKIDKIKFSKKIIKDSTNVIDENIEINFDIDVKCFSPLRDEKVIIGKSKGMSILDVDTKTITNLAEVHDNERICSLIKWGERCYITITDDKKVSVWNY